MKKITKFVLFIITLFFMNSCNSRLNNIVLNVPLKTNITSELQKVIDSASEGTTIELPKGTYNLDKAILMYQKKDIHLQGNGTILRMIDKTVVDNKTNMLSITRSENITLRDIKFDGNRANRVPRETACHSISITSSSDITLINIDSVNSVVDGFYIACYQPEIAERIPQNITLKNCSAINAFRNGLSIINGYKINIEGGSFSSSKGTAPNNGIDIEPNVDTTHPGVKDVSIRNVEFRNNKGWALLISQKGTSRDIEVEGCKFINNLGGIKMTSIHTRAINNTFIGGRVGIESLRYGGRQKDFNQIFNNQISGSDCGIKYSGYQGEIKGNTIKECKEYGIFLNGNTKDVTDVLIMSNQVSDIGKHAIHSNNFNKVTITENKIFNATEYGIYLTNGEQIIKGNDISNVANAICSVGSRSSIIQNTFSNVKDKTAIFRESSYGKSEGLIENNEFNIDKSIESTHLDIKTKSVIVEKNKTSIN